MCRRVQTTVLGLVVLVGPTMAMSPRQPPSLDAVLASAASYVAAFSQQVGGVVLEEQYQQQAQGSGVLTVRTGNRVLRSDLVVMTDPDFGWIEFRDVVEVDGTPVDNREGRIVDLFDTKPGAGAVEQARRIVQEGARFNLDAAGVRFDRTLNLPLTALRFLQAAQQPRSSFGLVGTETMAGRPVAVLRFTETAMPRMIPSPDDAAAQGRFWIDAQTGRVLRTELLFRSRHGTINLTATLRVRYVEEPRLQIWLPESMDEDYRFVDNFRRLSNTTVAGQAKYLNARKLQVHTEERFE